MYENEFTKLQARKAYRYLKRGICPPEKIGFFTVGLNNQLVTISSDLKSIENGSKKGTSRFLEALYGYGKSHLLNVIKALALEKKFAVAQISHDGYDRAFNHPTRYIHNIYENLTIPGFSVRGLGDIVPQLLRSDNRDKLVGWADKPTNRWGIGYYINRLANASNGSDPTYFKYQINNCDLQYRSGVYYYLLFEKLKVLSDLCHTIGLSGLVVLFDEVESIVTLLPNILSRLRSYEILNKLTNSDDFPYCCFYFAISPDFGHKLANWDFKYDYSYYKDLYPEGCRFMSKWTSNGIDIMKIPKIDKDNNRTLLEKLKVLHEYAYSWRSFNQITLDFIESFIEEAEKNSLLQRDIIRSFVNVMDICQQHKHCNPTIELALPVRLSLVEQLRNRGLEVIDNRQLGGALWVIGGIELMTLLKQFSDYGVTFKFAYKGGQTTKDRPAWWTRYKI